MEEEYLIEEVFLETDAPDTAEIEIEESNFANFIIQSENTNIETDMLATFVDMEIIEETTVEEYMYIVEHIYSYPHLVNMENFNAYDIQVCEDIINYYIEMEGIK